MEKVTLRVFRGDATGGSEADYEVSTFPGMVVLDAIHSIQAHQDSTLSCRWNCKAGKCGSCSAEINGKPRLLCKARVKDYATGGEPIVVHPIKAFPIIKDLVTDVAWNYRVSEKIVPFTPRADAPKPFVMQQIDVDRIQEFRKCIECFLCQDVCHILRDHNRKDAFYGPRQLIKLANLDMHPYDGLERRKMIREEAGVGFCNITKCCTEVCPEHIKLTDNAIIPLKERVADIYFDPVMWLVRKLTKKLDRHLEGHMFQLKSLSMEGITAALEKAERYRLLNEPREAESICLDVLEIDSENQKALVILLLSITDQFGRRAPDATRQARELLPRLRDEYERTYYAGIIFERQAKAVLKRGTPDGVFQAYDWFRNAMDLFEKAESIRPPGNDDALLRWNTCVRSITQYKLAPRQEDYVEPFLE